MTTAQHSARDKARVLQQTALASHEHHTFILRWIWPPRQLVGRSDRTKRCYFRPKRCPPLPAARWCAVPVTHGLTRVVQPTPRQFPADQSSLSTAWWRIFTPLITHAVRAPCSRRPIAT